MLKKLFLLIFFIGFFELSAQEIPSLYQTKKVLVSADTIAIEKVSINSEFFKIETFDGKPIDTSFYKVDFPKGKLIFKKDLIANDSVKVSYLKYPEFLTKTYSIYDQDRIVPNEAGNLYKVDRPVKKFVPFDGLNTSGSITRGVTVGNNQNSTVNSNLDLQITGRISDKVSLRASIQDSNIPLQDGGYSQKLDEFDQIFIELFTDKWNIRAGDLFLENRQSRFLNFNKKVQGLSTHFTFGEEENKTDIFASAALVRGQYAKSSFTGQEGNQGVDAGRREGHRCPNRKVQIVRFRGRGAGDDRVERSRKDDRHQPVHRGDELRRTSEDETRLCHSGGWGGHQV